MIKNKKHELQGVTPNVGKSAWSPIVGRLLIVMLLGVLGGLVLVIKAPPSSPKTPEDFVPLPYNLPGKYEGTPVALYIGNTHFSLAVDYLDVLTPHVGQAFMLRAAWPSMRSLDEEVTVNSEINIVGQLGGGYHLGGSILLDFQPLHSPDRFSDNYSTYVMGVGQMKQFEIERLDELGLYMQHRGGQILYWAIDEKVTTPYQHVPYAFICSVGGDAVAGKKKEPKPGDTCTASFKVNQDFYVTIHFGHNPRHLKDWRTMYFKVLEFIKSIEIAQK